MRQSGSRPGRPPKRASVGLSLAASHLAAAAGHHPQHSLKKHRMDNGDYYENGHLVLVRECSIAIVKARSKEEAVCRRGPHNVVAQEGNYRRRVIFSEDHMFL
ncbi:hypothetical protein HZH68_013688 [Vespula germanica]|uniref:Uncharacterized protein n=1 Tax=Vespula germanica TaxID=30212 RepID=A0A834JDN0_VESGE|nr:hypothetical protein HZH68_013688 [Vespula germanica]